MPELPTSPQLLVVGSIALDRLERGTRVDRRLGGAVTYGGLTAARLGVRVEAWSAMPEAWHAVARRLLAPVTLHLTPSQQPTLFLNRERAGSEREQFCTDRARCLRWQDAPFGADEHWDWVHFGPLHEADLAADLVTPLVARCRVSSLDLQGYARAVDPANGAIVARVADDLGARLVGLDWVKASDAEWDLVGAALGMSPAEAMLAFGWKGLLVTRGERGGTLHTRRGETSWRAAPAGDVVLETGAGDVFVAAFVARLISGGDVGDDRCRDALADAAGIAAEHVSGRWLDLDALALPG